MHIWTYPPQYSSNIHRCIYIICLSSYFMAFLIRSRVFWSTSVSCVVWSVKFNKVWKVSCLYYQLGKQPALPFKKVIIFFLLHLILYILMLGVILLTILWFSGMVHSPSYCKRFHSRVWHWLWENFCSCCSPDTCSYSSCHCCYPALGSFIDGCEICLSELRSHGRSLYETTFGLLLFFVIGL